MTKTGSIQFKVKAKAMREMLIGELERPIGEKQSRTGLERKEPALRFQTCPAEDPYQVSASLDAPTCQWDSSPACKPVYSWMYNSTNRPLQ
jgi:hypothetical protein